MIEDRISSLYVKLREAAKVATDAGITEEEVIYLLYSNAIDFLINLFDVALMRVRKSGK